jgi:hypothetical protein
VSAISVARCGEPDQPIVDPVSGDVDAVDTRPASGTGTARRTSARSARSMRIRKVPDLAPDIRGTAPKRELNVGNSPADKATEGERVERIRSLAADGRLAQTIESASEPTRTELIGGVFALVWPVVYERLTRKLEKRRGHRACTVGVQLLADDCLDRFYDDVEAVIDDVSVNADQPIHNLEAWVASRLTAATVNAHRRRRGGTGALQRPRLPQWLSIQLGPDEWLSELALLILVWVGIPATAGAGLWPLDQWSHRRALRTGDWSGSAPSMVERDIETVLNAMRSRRQWYDDYVETPLGHKVTSVVSMAHDPHEPHNRYAEPAPLSLIAPDDVHNGLLLDLAEAAIEVMSERLRAGEDARAVVVDVVRRLFASPTVDELDRPPLAGSTEDEQVAVLLADRRAVDRVVNAVLRIVDIPVAANSMLAGAPVVGARAQAGSRR